MNLPPKSLEVFDKQYRSSHRFAKVMSYWLMPFVFLMKPSHAAVEQSTINTAFSLPLIQAYSVSPLQIHIFATNLERAHAIYLLSVLAFENEWKGMNYQGSGGQNPADRLAAHLKHIVQGRTNPSTPSFESPILGGLYAGWMDVHIAFACAMAKNTPSVWSKLTANEKERLDWMMRAHAVIGHWHSDDDNTYGRETDGRENYGKTYNPNISHGPVALVIAAQLYFGNDINGNSLLNQYFQSFDFDELMQKCTEYGWNNIKKAWTGLGQWGAPYTTSPLKNVLENGGEIVDGPKQGFDGSGNGSGVRKDYKYQGMLLSDIVGIYRMMTHIQFRHVVVSEVECPFGTNPHIVGSQSGPPPMGRLGIDSPYNGMMGMAYELMTLADDGSQHVDSGGYRSEARYSTYATLIHMATRLSIELLEQWPETPATVDIERRFTVGTEDLLFKLREHYYGRANSTWRLCSVDGSSVPVNNGGESYEIYGIANLYNYGMALWDRIQAASPPPASLMTPPVSYLFEAEEATVSGTVAIGAEDSAVFATFNTPTGSNIIECDFSASDKLILDVDVDHFFEYTVWVLARSASGSSSVFFKAHGDRTEIWAGGAPLVMGRLAEADGWAWRKFSIPRTLLHVGLNEIAFLPRQHGLQIDKIMLTTDPDFLPNGKVATGGEIRPISASANVNNAFAPRAIDGKNGIHSDLGWYSGLDGGGVITMDLGGTYTIRGVSLALGSTSVRTFTVEVFNGTTWTAAGTYTASGAGGFYQDFLFAKHEGISQIRINTTSKWLHLQDTVVLGDDNVIDNSEELTTLDVVHTTANPNDNFATRTIDGITGTGVHLAWYPGVNEGGWIEWHFAGYTNVHEIHVSAGNSFEYTVNIHALIDSQWQMISENVSLPAGPDTLTVIKLPVAVRFATAIRFSTGAKWLRITEAEFHGRVLTKVGVDHATANPNASLAGRTIDGITGIGAHLAWYPGVNGGGWIEWHFPTSRVIHGINVSTGNSSEYTVNIQAQLNGQWQSIGENVSLPAGSDVLTLLELAEPIRSATAIRFTTGAKWLRITESEFLGEN